MFNGSPHELSSVHDAPWTVIRLAHVSRKLGLIDVSATTLARLYQLATMDVFDAFQKAREQILACLHSEGDDSLLPPHMGPSLLGAGVAPSEPGGALATADSSTAENAVRGLEAARTALVRDSEAGLHAIRSNGVPAGTFVPRGPSTAAELAALPRTQPAHLT